MPRATWPLFDAKNRLSELIDLAIKQGPQTITRRGREAAVVISMDEFRKLSQPTTDLAEFMARSPLAGLELEIDRTDDEPREIDL